MTKRISAGLLAFVCCALLAACGSGTKVNSAAFLSKCQTDLAKNSSVKSAGFNVSSICQCVQQKLVAKGDGNKTTDDNSAKPDAEQAGTECGQAAAAQAIGGSGSSSSSGSSGSGSSSSSSSGSSGSGSSSSSSSGNTGSSSSSSSGSSGSGSSGSGSTTTTTS